MPDCGTPFFFFFWHLAGGVLGGLWLGTWLWWELQIRGGMEFGAGMLVMSFWWCWGERGTRLSGDVGGAGAGTRGITT